MGGHLRIDGVLLIYLHQEPDVDNLKAELAVIEQWLKHWQAGDPDVDGATPNQAARPAHAALVRASQHPSTNTPEEDDHITLAICSEDGWKKDPSESRALVHIYSRNQKPKDGYEGYQLHGVKKNVFSSPKLKDAITEALASKLPQATS
ncbi:hypothetical protein LTR37_005078 [Vermiconidia calcicola]|uniref:Uncharacterized protein n=1 Tax=Vermiconidia calcicola TaxID=1690605 RepID=A0ACC3NNB7_9PEZI|nr:hypothetical protein LTR37_005078 [Vermiconidia calcicola]